MDLCKKEEGLNAERKGTVFSKPEYPVNVIKEKQAFYVMVLLFIVILCFIVSASGCIGDREPVSQEGQLNLTVIPAKNRVAEGEIFDIELVLKNTGNKSVNVWKLMEQISYDINFVDSNGSYVPYICGVLERLPLTNKALVELQPGESLKISQDSSYWALPPGEYTLFAEYHTSDGKQPENVLEDLGLHDVIYRDVVISVGEYRKNSLFKRGCCEGAGRHSREPYNMWKTNLLLNPGKMSCFTW